MKRTIAFLMGVALIAALGTAGAYFTAQTQVAENIIRSGTVEVSCEPTVSAVSVDGLAPGKPQSSVLSVKNDGSLASSIVVTEAKKMGITAFYESLDVKVSHLGRVLYNGPLMGMRTLPVDLEPGEIAELDFEVLLPAEADDDLAGDYVKLTLYVDAEQLHN